MPTRLPAGGKRRASRCMRVQSGEGGVDTTAAADMSASEEEEYSASTPRSSSPTAEEDDGGTARARSRRTRARSRTRMSEDQHADSSSRAPLSRANLLRSLNDLSPQWQPWRMNAAERLAWYRIGDDLFDHTCNNSKDWLLVGRRYENKKQFEEAAQAYSRSIRLNPHCSHYYFRLGCTQCEMGEWSGAIESFQIAVTLAPDYTRAAYYFNLGYAHSELRSWSEAIDALKQAIEMKPMKHVYHNLIAVCYRHANEYELSIRHYKFAISLDRIQPAYRRNLAYVYMQLKQWGKAVKAWSGAIDVASRKSLPELYRNRAFAQAERGYLAVACQDMSQAYDLYVSTQQRRRCREKLERWTSRLQGTEAAYIRSQHSLALERSTADQSDSDLDPHARQRTKVRQMAGLIQGEWEEWQGEDDEEAGSAASEEDNQDVHPSRRKRLDMVKRSRLAPPTTRTVRTTFATDAEEDERRFEEASSSAQLRRLIAQVGLDRPYAEKQAEEEAERQREEQQAAKQAKRDERARRRAEKVKRREERRTRSAGGDTDERATGTSHDNDSSCDSSSDLSSDDDHATASPSSHDAASSASLLSDGDGDDLYSEDATDPYSSLAKLFIRLRIDAKYLWRFHQASIHLGNIHLANETEMRRVLPALGPRLTLMNFLQERISQLRAADGLADLPASVEAELVKARLESGTIEQRLALRREAAARSTHQEVEEEASRITSTFRRRGRLASPSPARSPTRALNPINATPLVPVSPHNGVVVQRPLSARDRRTIYDAHSNARSAKAPIRTIGSVTWKA